MSESAPAQPRPSQERLSASSGARTLERWSFEWTLREHSPSLYPEKSPNRLAEVWQEPVAGASRLGGNIRSTRSPRALSIAGCGRKADVRVREPPGQGKL
jgi:hypothetical protein